MIFNKFWPRTLPILFGKLAFCYRDRFSREGQGSSGGIENNYRGICKPLAFAKLFFEQLINRSNDIRNNWFRSVVDSPFLPFCRIIFFKESFIEVDDWITTFSFSKKLLFDFFNLCVGQNISHFLNMPFNMRRKILAGD